MSALLKDNRWWSKAQLAALVRDSIPPELLARVPVYECLRKFNRGERSTPASELDVRRLVATGTSQLLAKVVHQFSVDRYIERRWIGRACPGGRWECRWTGKVPNRKHEWFDLITSG